MDDPANRVTPSPRDRLIVALDVATVEEATRIVTDLGETATFYKIGYQLIFAGGLSLAERLVGEGKQVFLDMKLLDIDNTVARGVENIARIGVTMLTLHAYPKAMRAAVSARGDLPLKLLGVTVLTSMDDADLVEAGYHTTAAELVARRAAQAVEADMDGVVCAPTEARVIREQVGPNKLIVTPGIRPASSAADDQKRIMTPARAIAAGADHLVVGRPIVNAGDRRKAAEAIVEEIVASMDR